MDKAGKKVDSLTGLRGIFILMIVFYHMGGYLGSPFSSVLRLPYKWGGVMGNSFFFMLSGFVISYGYRDRLLQGQTDFGGFIKKRLAKLYPMYLITNVIQACLLVCEQGMVLNLKGILPNLFMVTTGWVDNQFPYNVSCWFVSVLLLCHIVYYVLCRMAKGNPAAVLYMNIILVFWGYLLLSRDWDIPFCYATDGEGMLNFFLGCTLFEICERNGIRGNRKLLGGLLGLLCLSLSLAYQAGFERFSGDSRLFFAFLVSPAALLLALEVKWIGRVLESRLLTKLGQISMYVFYWHMPIIVLANLLVIKGWLGGVGARIRFVGILLLILLWAAVMGKLWETMENVIKRRSEAKKNAE